MRQLCTLFLLLLASSTFAATIYVNATVVGGAGNGSSWANAFPALQPAIDAAQSGDQIWVARGTYKPTTSTTDRDASFVMKENVKIYGGFTSGQMNLADRTTDAANTILSGDINNDNALFGNSFNVIRNRLNGLTASAVLDGFTITGGNADIDLVNIGGGIYSQNADLTIANCLFVGNHANSQGGAIYNEDSNPTLVNCTFLSNTAQYGGALANYSYINPSFPNLTNCSFLNNTAEQGGDIYNDNSNCHPKLTNCIVFGTDGNSIINFDNSAVTANFSLFQAFEADYTGSNNLTTTVNPFISSTSTTLRLCSPAIDAGSDAAYNGPATDLAGNPRTVRTIDMGAYEYQGAIPPPYSATIGGGGTIASGGNSNLTVALTGGNGPYTVVYTDGSFNASVTGYASGANISVSPTATTSYTLVSVTDASGCTASTLDGSATVTVTNPPTALALSPQTVAENVAANTTVGTFTTTDPDAGDNFTYTLVSGAGDGDNAAFTISGDELRITNSPDFETKSSYAVRVRTTDGGGLFLEQPFTIMVTDIDESTAPTVSTNAPTNVTANGATLGGNVTADGGASVTERGVVYVVGNATPTTGDNKVTMGNGTGSFTQSVTGLAASTTYSVRAYAINGAGTSYGATLTFATPQNIRCGPNGQNVLICYYGTTQCVSEKSAKRYLELGATLGPCGSGNARISYAGADAVLSLGVEAYPNPTSGLLNVRVQSPGSGPAQFEVVNVQGRAVQQRAQELVEGLNEVPLDLTTQPAGTYLIRCRDAGGRQAVVRVNRQ